MYFILFSHVTSACFSISNKTRLTRTKVRTIIVLAVGIRITDGRNNAAFIYICEWIKIRLNAIDVQVRISLSIDPFLHVMLLLLNLPLELQN